MYEFYNPHPQQKIVGDCVKRALTKVSGKTYQEVSIELNRIKREIGAPAYNSNSVWKKYLTENLKAICVTYPAEKGKPRMNGQRFCESHPKGTYVLNMAGHLSSCVDGVIYDTWDCREKCVYSSYLIPPAMVLMPGIEKLGELKEEYPRVSESRRENGDDLITLISEKTMIPIKTMKNGQKWIPLTHETFSDMLSELVKRKHLRCNTRRGSKKSTWWDEETGMTLITKSGDSPYIWCTKVGD